MQGSQRNTLHRYETCMIPHRLVDTGHNQTTDLPCQATSKAWQVSTAASEDGCMREGTISLSAGRKIQCQTQMYTGRRRKHLPLVLYILYGVFNYMEKTGRRRNAAGRKAAEAPCQASPPTGNNTKSLQTKQSDSLDSLQVLHFQQDSSYIYQA